MAQISSGRSFSVKPYPLAREAIEHFKNGNSLKAVEKFDNNGKVDLIYTPKGETPVLISGDKIALNELGEAIPELPLDELSQYDRNKDGFIEESELKVSIRGYSSAVVSHIKQNPDRIMAASWGGAAGGALVGRDAKSTLVGGIAGALVGAFVGNGVDFIGSYKTEELKLHEALGQEGIVGLR